MDLKSLPPEEQKNIIQEYLMAIDDRPLSAFDVLAIGFMGVTVLLLLWIVFAAARALVSRKQRKISFFHPASLVATCLGVGHIPFAPGTFGTIFGIILLVILTFQPRAGLFSQEALLPIFYSLTILLYVLGAWAADVYGKRTGKEDASEIVIDEVVGMWIAVGVVIPVYGALLAYDKDAFLYFLVLSPAFLLAGFILFRVFDIRKPWLVGWAERHFKGGHGVMMDDVIAGVYAAIAFYILFFALHFSGGFFWIFQTYFPDWVGPIPPERVY